MIPCGRTCCFVVEVVLTFCEGGFSLWPGIKPVTYRLLKVKFGPVELPPLLLNMSIMFTT